MAFNKDVAPKNRKDFMEWYRQQTKWEEKHSYDDPKNTSKELNDFFLAMIKKFPAMHGPFASDDCDDPKVTDYSIGKDVIYSAFAWSIAEDAYKEMFQKAKENNVGFFDVSANNGDILFSNEKGNFLPIEKMGKPWWKFW